MIGVIATLKIKEGTNEAFEAAANKLAEKVNANEDGVVYYDLFKDDETTYIKELGAEMGAFMTEAPDIKMLKLV